MNPVKHAPATPLPWTHNGGRAVYDAEGSRADVNGNLKVARDDAAYIVHACNNYGRLVARLESIIQSIDGHVQPTLSMKWERQMTIELLRDLGESDA